MELIASATYLQRSINAIDEVLASMQAGREEAAMLVLVRGHIVEVLRRLSVRPQTRIDRMAEGRGVVAEIATRLGIASAFEAVPPSAACDRLAELAIDLAKLPAEHIRPGDAELLERAARWEAQQYLDMLEFRPEAAPGNTKPAMTPEILERGVQEKLPGLRVEALDQITGGYGKETFRIRVRYSNRSKSLIVRKSGNPPLIRHAGYQLAQEYALLCDLRGKSFPAPEPIAFVPESKVLDGDLMLMEVLDGSPVGSFVEGASRISESTIAQVAATLAEIHAVTPEMLPAYLGSMGADLPMDAPVSSWIKWTLASWREHLASGDFLPSAFAHWLLKWLENNVPDDPRPPRLLHGDYGVHNLLLKDGQLTGVLDWEAAKIGAPEQDLAYIRPHVEKHIAWERFIEFYLAAGGRAPEVSTFSYYAALSAVPGVLGPNRGIANVLSGQSHDVRGLMMERAFLPQFMANALDAACFR